MTLWVVAKYSLVREHPLSVEAAGAVEAAAAGRGDARQEREALCVIRSVREEERWIACDCLGEGKDRPLVAPCRLPGGAGYTWRVLTGEARLDHDRGCPFYRPRRLGGAVALEQEPREVRARPEGFFAVLGGGGVGDRLGPGRKGREVGEEVGRGRVPVLSRLLLGLMERAGFTRARAEGRERAMPAWLGELRKAAAGLAIAENRPLADLLFLSRGDWDAARIHARVRAAARSWPKGSGAEGFLICAARRMDRAGLAATSAHEAIAVERGLERPMVGGAAVPGLHLFIGAIGEAGRGKGYRCIAAYAQPIVAAGWPVAVDSHSQRQAFGTLRTTLRVLQRQFPGAEIVLEKPVFEIETPDGPCLPDFIVRVRRGSDELACVVEVTGVDRPSYLAGKEIAHSRMRNLGAVLFMDGKRLVAGAITEEGRMVTEAVAAELRRRWA